MKIGVIITMISKDEVKHIADLARLKLDQEEVNLLSEQLSDILDYIDKLNELDTEDVVPTAYTIPMNNVLREDEAKPSIARNKALSNAPQKDEGQFKVPKIISD